MSAHVLLNLLNELGKRDKQASHDLGKRDEQASHFIFFATSLINSIIQEHER